MTLAVVEQYGVDRLLDELGAALRAGTYRPQPVLRRADSALQEAFSGTRTRRGGLHGWPARL